MAGTVKRVPTGYHTLTPHLVIREAAKAIEFYRKAFGAEELVRHLGPDGKTIMHADLRIGDSHVLLTDEFPNMGAISPLGLNGTPVTLHMFVEDVDRVFNQAVQAGATVKMPVADMFWGDRYGLLADPFGHQWAVASRIKDLTPEEMKKAAQAAFSGPGGCN